MIIDSHVHFGGTARFKHHTVEELLAIARASGVDRLVQITVGSSVGQIVTPEVFERAIADSLADSERHPDGVIAVFGLIDETAEDAVERLDALVKKPLIIGFRVTSGNLPGTKRILEDPGVVKLLAAAERLGTVVQIFAPFQTREMLAIARRFRNLRLLIDHMGLRFQEDEDNKNIFREWPALMELAAEPNVWIKVSYFPEAGSAFDPYPYPTAQCYFKQLYEHAGASRLIWGSNFPPVLRVCGYAETIDFVREHCTFLSPDDRAAILGGNFMRDFAHGVRR